jgi:hypothetical protein
MNTIANWSDADVFSLRKTPYTATLGIEARRLQGSNGYWGKFCDVFDPEFAEAAKKTVSRSLHAGDPWCIGYFVDNELSWGDEFSLALATLQSPPDQAAKKVFVSELQVKYETIEKLNRAWGTKHGSWDALLQSTAPPDREKAEPDLGDFETKFAEEYFQTCRNAVKSVDPRGLYLGCRFAWTNDRAIRAAVKYCDVVSFNKYERGVGGLKLPDGGDKPIIIGEFHFGALDRGMFHTGLVPTASQEDRGAAYKGYVESGLKNPLVIGTHWFQFGDQATTGRGDGENYQIGFLDVCDTPYPEIVDASRQVGEEMYSLRAKLTPLAR